MAISQTSLSTSRSAGQAGHLTDTNTVQGVVNDLTTVFNGWQTTDRAVKTGALVASLADYGGVADCDQPNTSITLTNGSPTATVGTLPATLAVGHTLVIDGAGSNYTVTAIAGTTLTLSANASITGTKKFIFGTDNTAAFNQLFEACLFGRIGLIPNGRLLITGTVGIPEPGSNRAGILLICGGGGGSTVRLDYMAAGVRGGSTIVWGGAAGGTMVRFARVSYVNMIGGLALVGQASYDPGAVFTAFGPRAGLGLHLSQDSTPTTGTGYMTLGDLVCSDMDQAIQFASNSTDNNCDTTIINRLVLYRCNNGIRVAHTQGLSYQFRWIHAMQVTGYVVKVQDGGAVEIGSLHLSTCGTASADATVDTYCLDLSGGINGYIFKVALMRIEASTVRAIAVRSAETHVQIGLFTESLSAGSVDKTFFLMQGGTLQILGGLLQSNYVAGERPFSLTNDVNSRSPRLLLSDMALPTSDWAKLFTFNANATVDISIVAPRNALQVVQPDRHTRLERGRVMIGGPTTDAATAVRLDPMMVLGGTSYVYSRSPRIPKGTVVVRCTIVGDHGNNTPSVFKRRYTIYRDGAGASTVVNTETIGTDIVTGTDQVLALAIVATYHTINLSVQGTAATTVNWRAIFEMESMYAATPDK